MELLFLGLIIGLGISFFAAKKFIYSGKKNIAEKQSVLLLEKIKSVCKLVTVEGEFAEIYHHENTKENFLGLFSSKKKALILINAKTHIGFDFRKIKMTSDVAEKKVFLTEFPQPEVISLETDLKYYDIQNGLLNKFDSADLTELNKEAKEHVLKKIPASNLLKTANKEALQAILLMQSLAETIGWQVDTSALEIPDTEKKLLD